MTPLKHLPRHIAASGQAFWQSGKAGFSGGQHGMPSAISMAGVAPGEVIASCTAE